MMKYLLLAAAMFFGTLLFSQQADEIYPVDSASVKRLGVPEGEILHFNFSGSKIFPGTTRECSVYVPAQYDPAHPACLYVNQDGIQFNAPVVFDNLIAQKEMPVTIGVFITPGTVKPDPNDRALDRYNRSFEYDGMGDNYVRFLLEEILPEVETKRTSDGRAVKLSKMARDRAIGGSSSGAVCAFTAAWERPDAFSRVFSSIGTFVDLRGADAYPSLIRKYEPRPIRVFLQDGSNDLNIYGGDWWMANQTMERALTFAGYEVQHVWGRGGHNGKQAAAIFPAAMRWLWKDYPQPVAAGRSSNQFLTDLLVDGQSWQLVGQGYQFTEGITADAKGVVYFQDIPNAKTYRLSPEGKPVDLRINSQKAGGTAFGPGNIRYVGAGRQILRYDTNGNKTVIANDVGCNDLVVAKNGNIYITEPKGTDVPSNLILITPGGKKSIIDKGLMYNNGLALTPDQTQLYVDESPTPWVWIYRLQKDGSVGSKQRFGRLVIPGDDGTPESDGMKCDTAGRLYVATKAGVQILDQLGRVNAVLPVPSGQVSNLCFGGEGFNVLYITCGDKVYSRKLNTKGVNTIALPVVPAKPHL